MNDWPSEARKTPGAFRPSGDATWGSSIRSPTERNLNCLCGASGLTVGAGSVCRSAPQAASEQAARATRRAATGRALTRPVLAVRARPGVRLEVDLLQAPAREMRVELGG